MSNAVEELLATWREAERALATLPDVSPDHETVALTVKRLRDTYQSLTAQSHTSHSAVAASRSTVEAARAVLARVAAPRGGGPSAVAVITALTFPPGDAVFALRVDEALAPMSDSSTEEAVEHLYTTLRPVHPDVRVTVRSDIAADTPVIEVHRDGGTPRPHRPEWIFEDLAARVVTDGRGMYVDANDDAARLFGVPRDRIIGQPAGTFTRPDVKISDAAALWALLEREGELHSRAILRRGDATELPVEFVTVRDADGPGRHVTFLRPA